MKKNKEFECDDKDPQCGKIRLIEFGDDQTEICYVPYGKKPRLKCVVVNDKDIIKFLFK